MKFFTFNTFGKNEWWTIHRIMEVVDVGFLQECSTVSASYNTLGDPEEMLSQKTNGTLNLVHMKWGVDEGHKIKKKGQRKTVNNYRCSMSIVVWENIIAYGRIDPGGERHWLKRPILAVVVRGIEGQRNRVYFNVHAPANEYLSKQYMREMLPRMREYAIEFEADWYCGGDFNLPPFHMIDMIDSTSEQIVRTGSATHLYSDEKDYFIFSSAEPLYRAYHASDFDLYSGGSDHLPIIMSPQDPMGKPVTFATGYVAAEMAALKAEREKDTAGRQEKRRITALKKLGYALAEAREIVEAEEREARAPFRSERGRRSAVMADARRGSRSREEDRKEK